MSKFVIFNFIIVARVAILVFFAASVQGGKIYIWTVLLIHCLLMALFFRPKNDDLMPFYKLDDQRVQQSNNWYNNFWPMSTFINSAAAIRKWMRKSFLAVSLVFIQIFTFIPFKKSKTPEEMASRTTYATCFYLVSINLIN